MPTWSKVCSQIGSFSYAKNFALYMVLTENIDPANNRSSISYNVYCQSSGSGSIHAYHTKYFRLNGTIIVNEANADVNASSPNAYIPIASGTSDWIYHNGDGSKTIEWGALIKANSYGVYAEFSGEFQLTTFARKPVLTINSVTNVGLNSCNVNYTHNSGEFWNIQYSLNGGVWQSIYGNPTISITGLNPNTDYSVRVRGLNQSGSLIGDASNSVSFKTLPIAYTLPVGTITHGDSFNVTLYNPSGANIITELWLNSTFLKSLNLGVGIHSVTFTQAELDNLYKQYSNDNKLILTLKTVTAGMYVHSQNITIVFTGNQKTIYRKVNGSWKRGNIWKKVNESWKRGVIWRKVGSTWKKGI